MASSKAKSVTAAAAFFFAALTLAALVACEGPEVSQPGSQPPSTGSGMVVRCAVCKGTGSIVGHNGYRRECENCNGTGKVKHTK